MRKTILLQCVVLFCFGFSGVANAALYDRGNGLIYDDVQNITWLQDANYSKTSGDDNDGLMTYAQATAWVDGLVYQGYDNWRLPFTPDVAWKDYIDPKSGEMGHLFYVTLGNPEGGPLNNSGLFINIITMPSYWSTEYTYEKSDKFIGNDDLDQVWAFLFGLGSILVDEKYDKEGYWNYFPVWPVHNGDVAAVPIPGAAWLLGSGLLCLISLRRKR